MPHLPSKISAGLLMFRRTPDGLEVFLAHPGGPFFKRKDEGVWTIPKGAINPDEHPLDAARREFAEETGIISAGEFFDLGSIKQKGGKTVLAWAFEGDWDSAQLLVSNTFSVEWPPKSGQFADFPEIDRVAFFTLPVARRKILESQQPLLDRLVEILEKKL